MALALVPYLLWALALFVGFILSILVYASNPYWRWALRKVPGPPPAMIGGNMAAIGRHRDKLIGAIHSWSQLHGPVYKCFPGFRPWVVVADPAVAREVMVTRFSHFAERGWVNRSVSALVKNPVITAKNGGLLVAEGEYWRGTRATWHRFFNHSVGLSYYKPVMEKAVDDLMATLGQRVSEGEATTGPGSGALVLVSRCLQSMTMVIVGGSAFGQDFSTEDYDKPHPIVKEASAFFEGSVGATNPYVLALNLFPHLLPLWRTLANAFPLGRMIKGRNYLDASIRAWIWEIRRGADPGALAEAEPMETSRSSGTAHAGQVQGKSGEDGAGKGRPAHKSVTAPLPGSFVRMLAKSEDKATGLPLSDVQVTSHTLTAVVAGYETTSGALSFALYLLAKHPEAQARAAAEAIKVVQGLGAGTELGPEQMPYLEAVLSETLRLYPAGPVVHREAASSTTLAGYTLPKGTIVAINIYSMHRDPAHWSNPEAFRPERFLGPDPEPCIPGAYLPFGAGPRSCVGMKFALQEAKLALARLLDRFRFELPPGMEDLPVRFAITLAPRDGLQLRVYARGLSVDSVDDSQ